MVLSGCNLFPINNLAYLNQKVATIEYTLSNDETKTLTITKKDLINAYNTSSEQLSQYGLSGEEAYDQVLEMLINTRVILEETRLLIEEGDIVVTNLSLNKIYNNTYDALIDNIGTFEEEVIKAWDLTTPSELGEEETSDVVEYAPYVPTAEIVKTQNGYEIRTIDKSENENVELVYSEKGKELSSLYDAVYQRIGDSKVLKEALKRYIDTLRDNEEGQKLSTDDKTVFEREIERIYNNVKDNEYVNLYNEHFENKTGASIITVNQVLTYITEKMVGSYNKYQVDSKAYETDILEARDDLWYVMDNEYFYVTHILVNFSEDQKEAITSLEESYKSGQISYQDYLDTKEQIANTAKVKANGEETSLNPIQLLNKLQNDLQGKTDAKKAEIIRDYVYTYSEDNGNKNKNYEYIVGTENSKMVEEFNEVARSLHNDGKGQFGDVSSEFAISEYGVHILVYVAPVENAFTITNVNTFDLATTNETVLEETISVLTNTKLSPFYGRTMFDFVFEKLATDNFSKFENMNINTLKKDLKIQIYHNNYKDLWEQ